MPVLTGQSSWVEIDLAAIENNIQNLIYMTRVTLLAVVKANAYGHGMLPVARAVLRAGAEFLGVARIEEALELRESGIAAPILVMGYIPPDLFKTAINNQISMAVWNTEQIDLASNLSKKLEYEARLHLKIDTGMSRLGAPYDQAYELAEQISTSNAVKFEGLFTHFACSDEIGNESAALQEHRFRQIIENLRRSNIQPGFVHMSNSGGIINRPGAKFDMVRAGISVYGLHPSPETRLPDTFRPALSWKSIISQIKSIPPGTGVSYGHEYISSDEERIGTVPVGYADGFRRISGNKVLVAGKVVPVLGRVCMDQIIINLDDVPGAQTGDEVILIGRQDSQSISAGQLGERWGTINYEVVCGISRRVPRFYVE